mgnify:CR=1 FL=1|jgi:hypothetical protein
MTNYSNYIIGTTILVIFIYLFRMYRPIILENFDNGLAGNSSKYAEEIKTQTIELQDKLLISKYKTDYEDVIINMSDNIDIITLSKILSLDNSDEKKLLKSIQEIETLNKFKTILNSSMKYLDSQ